MYGPVQMLQMPTSLGSCEEDAGLAKGWMIVGLKLLASLSHSRCQVLMNSVVLGIACSATLAVALVAKFTAGLAMNCIALIVFSNMLLSPEYYSIINNNNIRPKCYEERVVLCC